MKKKIAILVAIVLVIGIAVGAVIYFKQDEKKDTIITIADRCT